MWLMGRNTKTERKSNGTGTPPNLFTRYLTTARKDFSSPRNEQVVFYARSPLAAFLLRYIHPALPNFRGRHGF